MSRPSRKPLDKDLYADVVAEAKARFDVWPSAYASGWVVRTYKERGGRYGGGDRKTRSGLTKWFGESWVDLSRPIHDEDGELVGYEPCGRKKSGDPADYPKCRPAKEAMRMSPAEVKDAIKRKRAAEAKAGRGGAKGRGGRGARAPVRVSTYRTNPDGGANPAIATLHALRDNWAAGGDMGRPDGFVAVREVGDGGVSEAFAVKIELWTDDCLMDLKKQDEAAARRRGEALAKKWAKEHWPHTGYVDLGGAEGVYGATWAWDKATENEVQRIDPDEVVRLPAMRENPYDPEDAVFDWDLPGTRGIREVTVDDVTILYGYDGESAHIASVRTKAKAQGQGKARRVLELFCEEADALGIPIKLEASPLTKKVNRARLVAFYESLGFEKTGRTINPAGDPEMMRLPVRVPTYRANPDVDAFRRWFGDSKVVDEDGQPLVVYHGTDKSFDVFKSTTKEAFYGKGGMYFSNVREAAQTFAPSVENVMSVYLALQNPYFDDGGDGGVTIAKLKRQGFDGIVREADFVDADGDVQDHTMYVAFYPEQIKLADGTNTTFDPTNPDVRANPYDPEDDPLSDVYVVATDELEDGTVVKFVESPFPYERKPLAYNDDPKVQAPVNLAHLIGTQRRVTVAGVEKYLAGIDEKPPRPGSARMPAILVYETSDGRQYIADGHHRAFAALLRDMETFPAIIQLVRE